MGDCSVVGGAFVKAAALEEDIRVHTLGADLSRGVLVGAADCAEAHSHAVGAVATRLVGAVGGAGDHALGVVDVGEGEALDALSGHALEAGVQAGVAQVISGIGVVGEGALGRTTAIVEVGGIGTSGADVVGEVAGEAGVEALDAGGAIVEVGVEAGEGALEGELVVDVVWVGAGSALDRGVEAGDTLGPAGDALAVVGVV